MIRLLFIFLIITTALSCGSDHKSSVNTASTQLDIKKVEAPVPFAGSWISETYLEDIQKHKSPRKAQEGSEEVFIQIPATTLKSTNLIYNFHETGYELVTLKENDQYQLWEKQNDSLVKPMYKVEILSPDKIKLGEKTYTKINPVTENKETRILEEILFKGNYTTKKGQKVEFKNNGEVTGLDQYKYYVPLIDYFDAGLQIDQVGLGETREKLEYFGFKFKADGLDLYKIKCLTYEESEKRCVDVDFGEKVYQLKKE